MNRIARLLLWAMLLISLSKPAMSQSVPFSAFQTLTDAELASVQIKLTYVGIQEDVIATVVINATPSPPDMKVFVTFRHSGVSYANDALGVRHLIATLAELRAIIDNSGAIPAVVAGSITAPEYLSFALVRSGSGAPLGFEVVLNQTAGASLMSAIRLALATNSGATTVIDDFSCGSALREAGAPMDVTSRTAVALSGLRLNRATGRFVGTASVKNISATPLPSPVSLVLGLPTGITLYNANGITCSFNPAGLPFVTASSTDILAGASLQINLEFLNPRSIPITATTKVLGGQGAP